MLYGETAIFAGGFYANGTVASELDMIDSFYELRTKSLPHPRGLLSAVVNGDSLYFAGGTTSEAELNSISKAVDVYTFGMGWIDSFKLNQERFQFAAVTLGNKIYFGGGLTDTSALSSVEVYNTITHSLSSNTSPFYAKPLQLPSGPGWGLGAAAAGKYVAFAGIGSSSDQVDYFDTTTLTWKTTKLSVGREPLAFNSIIGIAGVSVGNKIIFVGGIENGDYSDAMDIFDGDDFSHRNETMPHPL